MAPRNEREAEREREKELVLVKKAANGKKGNGVDRWNAEHSPPMVS